MKKHVKTILAAFLVLVMGLTSVVSAETAATPAETLDAFLKELREKEIEEFSEEFPPDTAAGLDEITGLDEELTQDLFGKLQDFEYELSNEQIDGDTATVDVTIRTYDFGKTVSDIILDFMGDAFFMSFTNPSEEEIQEKILSIVRKKTGNMEKNYEATVTVEMKKDGDEWVMEELSEDSPLLDALVGGLISTLKDYEKLSDSFTNDNE